MTIANSHNRVIDVSIPAIQNLLADSAEKHTLHTIITKRAWDGVNSVYVPFEIQCV